MPQHFYVIWSILESLFVFYYYFGIKYHWDLYVLPLTENFNTSDHFPCTRQNTVIVGDKVKKQSTPVVIRTCKLCLMQCWWGRVQSCGASEGYYFICLSRSIVCFALSFVPEADTSMLYHPGFLVCGFSCGLANVKHWLEIREAFIS